MLELAKDGALAFEGGFETGEFPPAVLLKTSSHGRTELAAGQLSEPGGIALRPRRQAVRHGRHLQRRPPVAHLAEPPTGEFVGEEKGSWSTEGLAGSIAPDGTYTASAPAAEAGLIKVSVGSLSGAARVRVLPPFPWTYDFEATRVRRRRARGFTAPAGTRSVTWADRRGFSAQPTIRLPGACAP